MQMKDIQDDQDLITYGNEFFTQSAKAKRAKERQWMLNLAFLAGDQLVKVNSHTGELNRVPVEYDPEWVVRIVDNRILPVYRTIMAKLTKNKPIPDAQAHSREENDIQAARAAIKLEVYHWQMLDLDNIHPEMVGWMVACGKAYYKQFWNPKKGERLVDDDPRMLELMNTDKGLTPDGKPQNDQGVPLDKIDVSTGDTDLVLRTPFNIYPQPGKKRLKDMTIIGDAEIMDAEEVWELYEVEVQSEKETQLTGLNASLSGAVGDNRRKTEKDIANPVTVKELYILPCRRFPKGIKYRWAGNQLLGKPEACPKIRIVDFNLINIPGQFFPKGIIDDLIPIQRRWNQLLSKIEMHNDLYNDPPSVYDSSRIDIDDYTTEPGIFIESLVPGADVRGAISPITVPSLDNAIFKELEILDAQFEIVPVINKVSFGKDTANATSGKAINFLQEKDDDIVRPLITNIEAGYAKVFQNDFEECQENYDEDRGFAIVGEDNKIEWVDFQKADLQSNLTLTVEAGSAMPSSKAAKQSMVMEMLTAGFFTDPRTGRPDFAKALKYLEFGSVDDIYQDNALDCNQAQRENEKLKTGQEVQVLDWHNHEAHFYEHNRMRKTTDYEMLDDGIKQIIDAHCLMHQEALKPPATPTQPVKPGGGNVQPEGQSAQVQQQMPTEQEVADFMQFLKQTRPDIVEQLLVMSPEQRTQEVLAMMQEIAAASQQQGQAQPPQSPQPVQQSPPGPVQ